MKNVDFAFIDSGTGGIPYMLELKKKFPSASCVYVGDTAHFPYGQKSREEIISCASSAIKTIIEKWNPKTLVIACNTMSVTALDDLRKIFPALPIVGTVPAIRLAAKVSRNRRIGLLATNATVSHPYCDSLIKNYASDCQIFKRGDPTLVDFVEHKLFTSSKEDRAVALKPALDYFSNNDCDTIILGCTHFTHIAKDIEEIAGSEVQVVDSRDGVANQAIKVEQEIGNSCDGASHLSDEIKDMSFYVTALHCDEENVEYKMLCDYFSIPWGGLIKL